MRSGAFKVLDLGIIDGGRRRGRPATTLVHELRAKLGLPDSVATEENLSDIVATVLHHRYDSKITYSVFASGLGGIWLSEVK